MPDYSKPRPPPRPITEQSSYLIKSRARQIAIEALGATDPRVDDLARQLAHIAANYGRQHK